MKLNNQLQDQIINASGSNWKKALWVTLAILGVLTIFIFVIVFLLARKNPVDAASAVVKNVSTKIEQIDADARLQVITASNLSEKEQQPIIQASLLPDPFARAEALAKLAKNDY